ncbi:MAG: LCP family protein [Eubacteriales bacterium]
MSRKILVILAILVAGILTGTAVFGLVFVKESHTTGDSSAISDNGGELTKRVSFLLIGADKRPGQSSFNADSIIVASVDPDTKIISLLSIPRDTRVEIGDSSFVKINAVPMIKGIPELMDIVTEITEIPLDGYVLTNFEGFKSIIDTVGGINIYVEKDMKYCTGDEVDGYIDLKEGEQFLTGSEALQYARFRNDSMADISRTARQQKVLKATAKAVLQVGTIAKLPLLVPKVKDAVETNLSLIKMLTLSKVATSFNSENIVTQTLPGSFMDYDGLSYWEVNREQAKKIAKNLLMGITTDRVIDNQVLDLLDSKIANHITVPGSAAVPETPIVPGGPTDPNSTESTGYEAFVENKDDESQNKPISEDKKDGQVVDEAIDQNNQDK